MINFEIVTIQDCIENYEMKNTATIINDGYVVDFIKEIPTQTANPSGDE